MLPKFGKQRECSQLLQYLTILKNSGYDWKKQNGNNDEYAFYNNCYRVPSVLESERLMTIPEGWVSRYLVCLKRLNIRL